MRNYDKPPIEEAIIEIRFQNNFSSKVVAAVKSKIGKRYAKSEDLNNFEFAVSIQNGVPSNNLKPKSKGVKFSSEDASEYFTFNELNAFATNRAPYVGWEVFSNRAIRDFDDVLKQMPNNKIGRIGIRFVNRLDIPTLGQAAVNVKEYLEIYPNIPVDLCPINIQALTQVIYKIPETQWTCQLLTVKVDSPLIDHVAIKLDIDVSLDGELPQKTTGIQEIVNEGRRLKNIVFERLITDKARELFQL